MWAQDLNLKRGPLVNGGRQAQMFFPSVSCPSGMKADEEGRYTAEDQGQLADAALI